MATYRHDTFNNWIILQFSLYNSLQIPSKGPGLLQRQVFTAACPWWKDYPCFGGDSVIMDYIGMASVVCKIFFTKILSIFWRFKVRTDTAFSSYMRCYTTIAISAFVISCTLWSFSSKFSFVFFLFCFLKHVPHSIPALRERFARQMKIFKSIFVHIVYSSGHQTVDGWIFYYPVFARGLFIIYFYIAVSCFMSKRSQFINQSVSKQNRWGHITQLICLIDLF